MEYYLDIYENEITKLAGKWMKLEQTIPREVTLTPEDRYGLS